MVDLIEFVAHKPRSYEEVMDAWRTSCPRLTIWEDAVDGGFVERRGKVVTGTDLGKKILAQHR